jgi:molybdopterin molybdotransferase
MSREFFSVRTVHEALAGFRPNRRTAAQQVALAEALDRVPAADVLCPHDVPGFARATVDGYAVRAEDTYGASESLPAYLTVAGSVRMGAGAEVGLAPGSAVAIPTGGALPDGADAVVMVEHSAEAMPGTIEVTRPAASGDGVVRGDEDVSAGSMIARAGRPLRAQDLGLLAAAGITSVSAYARPRVAIVSTGDEVVPAETEALSTGQVRDATAPALAALVQDAGGTPEYRGIVPDDPEALRRALSDAVASTDVVLVSAGSSVGARDTTAEVVASLGPPGIWCHGLSIKPGKPTLLAESGGVPIIGLPGNPLSALVVFRLVGMRIVRRVGGSEVDPPSATARAMLVRDLPSAAGRLDVVQVRVGNGRAEPLFGKSALLSVLAAADGFVVVPEEVSGLFAGTDVEVELYG